MAVRYPHVVTIVARPIKLYVRIRWAPSDLVRSQRYRSVLMRAMPIGVILISAMPNDAIRSEYPIATPLVPSYAAARSEHRAHRTRAIRSAQLNPCVSIRPTRSVRLDPCAN